MTTKSGRCVIFCVVDGVCSGHPAVHDRVIKGETMEVASHNDAAHSRQSILAFACLIGLALPGLAWSQAGIGVTNPTLTGIIGSTKDQSGPTNCPAGTLLTGMYHVDKGWAAQSMSRGMTTQIGLYCSRIVVSGGSVTLQQTTANGTPAVPGYAYTTPGTTDTKYCLAGSVVQQMGGSDRRTADSAYPVPWTSSMTLVCRPLQLNAAGWARTDGEGTSLQVGVKETNATHTERGPFCVNTGTTVTVGYYRQGGGEGYDGVNIYCSTLAQARHSAVLEFTDFAWSQLRGTTGWMVSLAQGTTTLAADAVRIPYSSAAANLANQLQTDHESFVIPGNNYRASLSQRPAGIAANTFHTEGNCLSGIRLINEQDASCSLMVTGLPDLRVTVSGPATTYNSPATVQAITMTAANLGPGATDNDDGFALRMTLPAGWTVGGALPANCAAAAQVVTCQLNPSPLAAAAAPDGTGGSQSFAIPVRPVGLSTPATSQPVPVALVRTVPDGDTDPTNNDYNTANDTASTSVSLSQPLAFDSCPVDAFVTRGDDLYTLNLVTGVFTLQGTISSSTLVNGVGFRSQDGYLWGWANGVTPSRLVRIGRNGESQIPYAAPPTGWAWGSYAADIDPQTGLYVTFVNRGSDTAPNWALIKIDVTTNTVVGVPLPATIPGGGGVTDIAFHPSDGYLYTISGNGTVFRINASTGATDPTGLQLPPNGTGGWGAIFFDNNGTMYAYKSNSTSGRGQVYRVFGIGTGGTLAFDILTDADTSNNLDGARCPSAVLQVPPALLLRKQTTGEAGGPFTFDLTNTTVTTGSATTTAANSPVVVNGLAYTVTAAGVGQPLTVTESALPAGWRLDQVVCTSGGTPVAPLAAGNVFTVPGNALGYGKLVECTVTNRRNVSTLAVTKTSSPSTAVRTGDTLVYTITAGNQGPDAADGSVLRDPAVAGMSCSTVTCAASGGAQCPGAAALTVAGLQGTGLTLPALPVNGTVTMTLTCQITASGY
jgi:uncharacterized repeat protein (TIGR01451 family)